MHEEFLFDRLTDGKFHHFRTENLELIVKYTIMTESIRSWNWNHTIIWTNNLVNDMLKNTVLNFWNYTVYLLLKGGGNCFTFGIGFPIKNWVNLDSKLFSNRISSSSLVFGVMVVDSAFSIFSFGKIIWSIYTKLTYLYIWSTLKIFLKPLTFLSSV